jgi:hypothetical protein
MWPVLIGCAIGAYVVGRGKPVTRFRKLQVVGPSTGDTYEAEDIPEAGLLVVRGAGPTTVAFLRQNGGGFVFYKAEGDPRIVERIVYDVAPHALRAPTGDES